MVSYAYWQNLNLCSWGCFEPLTTWVLNGEKRATRATKKKKKGLLDGCVADVGPARNVPQVREPVLRWWVREDGSTSILVTLDDVKKRNMSFT